MRTIPLRRLASLRVEPATVDGPTLNLDNLESGTGRIIGDLPESDGTGQNQFYPGDVLFSKLRPYLAKSFEVRSAMNGTGEFLCLVPGNDVDPTFLKYVTLSRPWLEFAEMTSYGMKMPRTSWEIMAQFRVAHLQDFDQRRIADFLDDRVSRIDDAIAARRLQLQLVQLDEQSQLTEALVKSSDLLARLRHLGVRVTTGPFGTVFAAADYVDGGVPMVNPIHILDGAVVADDMHSVSRETALRLARHRLAVGDLVVARKGDLGRTAMVRETEDGWICGSDSIALHPHGSQVDPEFLDHLLKLSFVRDQLLSMSSAVTMPSLSEGNLLSLRVPVLDRHDQSGRVLSARRVRERSRVARSAMTRSISLLTEYKQSLITAAVTEGFDVTTASKAVPA